MTARGKPASQRTRNSKRSNQPIQEPTSEDDTAGDTESVHTENEELPECVKAQFREFIQKTITEVLTTPSSTSEQQPSGSKKRPIHEETPDQSTPGKKSKGKGGGKKSKQTALVSLNDLTVRPSLIEDSDDESEPDSDEEIESDQAECTVRHSFGLLVGETLSHKLHKKVVTDKFVEMYDLLPTSIDKDRNLVIKSHEGGIRLMQESKKKFVTLSQWNEAFAVYISAYTTKGKTAKETHTLLVELLTYQKHINSLAAQNLAWYDYDRYFRQDKEKNPKRFTYADVRHDLITTLTLAKQQPFRPTQRYAKTYREHSRFSDQSGDRAGTPHDRSNGSSASFSKFAQGYCFKFHSQKLRCILPPGVANCRYKHECPHCTANHPAFKCQKSPTTRYTTNN